jgi:DUF971 family protein
MPVTPTASTNPEHISISKTKGLKIDWKDGHLSDYGLKYLRDHCPCATCTGAHGPAPEAGAAASPFPMFQPALRMVDVEAVGNYAIRIAWSDGHSAGIYSFEHFRSICPCAECRGEGPSKLQ